MLLLKVLSRINSLRISSFLMENAVNSDELKAKVVSMSKALESPKHRVWFQSQFFKHIVNVMGSDPSAIKVAELPSNAPEWARQAFQRGESLFQINISDESMERAVEVIDWLNKSFPPNKEVGLAWSEAVAQALGAERHERDAAAIKKGTMLVKKYDSGYYWVRLDNDECVKDDGERMANCLRYGSRLRDDFYYSLRTERGKSKVILPVRGKSVADIRAKGNEYLKEESLWPYVVDLIHEKGLEFSHFDWFYWSVREEAERMGLSYHNRKLEKDEPQSSLEESSLLERSRPKPIIMHHGTTDLFLKDILKHGLLANPPKRVFGDDEWEFQGMNYGKVQSPFARGLYLTKDWGLADRVADKAVAKFGGNPLVVSVQISQGSYYIDEEDIINDIIHSLISSFWVLDDDGKKGVRKSPELQGKVANELAVFIEDILERTGRPNDFAKGLIRRLAEAMVRKIVAGSDVGIASYNIRRIEEIFKGDEEIGQLIISLTKNVDRPEMNDGYVNRDIGFRGRNKIVRIYDAYYGKVIYEAPTASGLLDGLQESSLYERNRPQPMVMYHGTSDVFAREILKHGLKANPPKRNYPAIGGLYLTPYFSYAEKMATVAIRNAGGNPMIVTVMLSKGYGHVDEEAIIRIVVDEIYSAIEMMLMDDVEFEGEILDEYGKQDIIDDIIQGIKQRIGKMDREGGEETMRKFLSALFDQPSLKKFTIDEFLIPYIWNTPSLAELLKAAIKRISIGRENYSSLNRHVPNDIGFRGRNRIIGIEANGREIYKANE